MNINLVPTRLSRHQNYIQNLKPDSQVASYSADNWRSYFSDDPELDYLINRYPIINRGNVASLASATQRRSSSIRLFFLATMVWGLGTTGYGAFRTHEMLASPQASKHLAKAFAMTVRGDYAEAYVELRPINRLGPAFITKYIYFIGLGCNLKPLPIILDSRVAKSLLSLVGARDFANYGRLTAIGFVQYFPAGYSKFVALTNKWAYDLDCRPDNVEFFLFDPPRGF